MKTPEEGYALGWADAIYAYESKQKKNMSTVDDLMLAARGGKDWLPEEQLRAALESALQAREQIGYERGRRDESENTALGVGMMAARIQELEREHEYTGTPKSDPDYAHSEAAQREQDAEPVAWLQHGRDGVWIRFT